MNNILPAIVTFALLQVSVFHAFAKPKKINVPSGALKLQKNRIFTARGTGGELICGGKSKYIPGKMVGKKKAYFMPMKNEVARLSKRAKNSRTKKKIKLLKGKLRHYSLLCKAGPKQDLLSVYTSPLSSQDILHLYRKAGLGPPPAAAYQYIGGSAEALADFFLTYQPDPGTEAFANSLIDGDPQPPDYPEKNATLNGLNLYVLAILTKTQNQFHERFALVSLHDRLATSSRALSDSQRHLMLNHINMLRYTGGQLMDYGKLVADIGEDAAMIRWLNLDSNVKSAPNENYARELMELFLLGTTDNAGNPNYSNLDVQNMALAFTGWQVLSANGQWYVARSNERFDPNPRKILFKGTYYETKIRSGRDAVNHILSQHPNAQFSLARFLAEEYFRDDLNPAVVDNIADLIKDAGFSLQPVFRKIFSSNEFYTPENRFSVAKLPHERFIYLLRIMDSAGMPYNLLSVRNSLAGMGCILTQPETVFGCDKMQEIPIGQRLLRSANLITGLTNNNNLFKEHIWDYTRLFPYQQVSDTDLVSHFESLFGISLNQQNKETMLEYLNNAVNNKGVLVAEKWNPANPSHVRRKTAGLFRLFATHPQFHDLR